MLRRLRDTTWAIVTRTGPVTTNDRTELDSALSTLDDVIRRVADAATRHGTDRNESIAGDLYEVERSLQAGSRRLAALLRRMGS